MVTKLSKSDIYRARNKLKQFGLLEFKENGSNRPTAYKIKSCAFLFGTQNETASDTASETADGTASGSNVGNYNKTKNHKLKTKIKKEINKEKLGEFKNVLLTSEEFEKLYSDYGKELSGIIEHLSVYIEMKGYKAKSHYLAIKKWVALAYQEQKLRESNFESRKNQTYGGIINGAVKPDYNENSVCTEFSEGDEPPEGLYG